MEQRRERRRVPWLAAVLAIACAGLGLRVAYTLAVAHHDRHFYDAYYYEAEADYLARGVAIVDPSFTPGPRAPNADHPPLTALVLAPISEFTGGSALAMRLMMSGLGAIVIVAIGALGRLVGGPSTAAVAAALAAIYPNLWLNDTVIMAETLATLTVALVAIACYRLLRRPNPLDAVLAGAAAALATLTRAELLVLLALTVLPTLVAARRRASWRRIVALGAIVTATAAVVVAPWVVRNLVTFDRVAPLSTGDGLVLLGANCEPAYRGTNVGYWIVDCAATVRPPGDASVVNAAQRQVARDFIRANAGRLPAVVAARLGRTFGVYRPGQMVRFATQEGRARVASYAGLVLYYALVPLAVVGARRLRRDRVELAPLLSLVVITALTTATSYGSFRFRVPAEVTLVVLAAVAVASWPPLDKRLADRLSNTPVMGS